MENKEKDFKGMNPADLGGGAQDPDDGIEVMDNDAIAREKDWQNEFKEETTATVADVVDDEGEGKDILPGAKEAQAEVDAKAKADAEVEKGDNPVELTDELFDDALTSKEKEDLADLNKRFGTDFKDMKSFEDKFKKEEGVDEKVAEIETKGRVISYLEGMVKATPEELYYQDLRIQAHNAGQDVTDPELDEGFKTKVEESKVNGTLEFIGRSLRAESQMKLDKNKGEVESYNKSKVQTAEQKQATANEELKQATTKLYQGGKFYGIDVSQDQHMANYRNASNKTLIKEMEANPELLVEMTLLYNNREGLAKLSNSPSYSAGVKATFDAIKGQKSTQSAKVVIDKGQESDLPSHILDWVK